ncbi:hypothetical protein BB561_004689 [Smittium simulii]|uniref:Pyrroline-5-carboxylate reductase n=1 Tax=Smittium simulii TaxID=133385 RepID=A0A2T9YEU4_9FUNG|nr:hypothetical protein BB561_004689 [Smittium simulii]
MSANTISFIGGGNIAEAILSGLVKGGQEPSSIYVADPYEPQLQKLQQKYKVNTTTSNSTSIQADGSGCKILIIATKPQIVSVALKETAELIKKYKPLIISIAAGVTLSSIYSWIDDGSKQAFPVVRLMPNTPALIGEGAAGLAPNQHVSEQQKLDAESIVKQIAKEYFWFSTDEDIDSVTAISGSGPAYFFYVMEAMQKAAVGMGLDSQASRRLVAQTCLGAAKMVLDSEDNISELRQRVTSPNGTTFAAIQSMESNNVGKSIEIGCIAAKDRGAEISTELDGSSTA